MTTMNWDFLTLTCINLSFDKRSLPLKSLWTPQNFELSMREIVNSNRYFSSFFLLFCCSFLKFISDSLGFRVLFWSCTFCSEVNLVNLSTRKLVSERKNKLVSEKMRENNNRARAIRSVKDCGRVIGPPRVNIRENSD